MAKNDHRNIDGTENGKFVGLLEKTAFSLQKCPLKESAVVDQSNLRSLLTPCRQTEESYWGIAKEKIGENNLHRTITIIFDRLDLNLASTHCAGRDGRIRSEDGKDRENATANEAVAIPRFQKEYSMSPFSPCSVPLISLAPGCDGDDGGDKGRRGSQKATKKRPDLTPSFTSPQPAIGGGKKRWEAPEQASSPSPLTRSKDPPSGMSRRERGI